MSCVNLICCLRLNIYIIFSQIIDLRGRYCSADYLPLLIKWEIDVPDDGYEEPCDITGGKSENELPLTQWAGNGLGMGMGWELVDLLIGWSAGSLRIQGLWTNYKYLV